MPATKYDQGKPRLDLLPFEALQDVSQVLAFGAKKYGANNWRQEMPWSKMLGAALRHIFAWSVGETVDSESNLPHLAHAVCCLLFLLTYAKTGRKYDDRPIPKI